MLPWDEDRMREAIHVASSARKNGNHPFGALLADQNGQILLKAENTVVNEKDCTGHAETNLMRKASGEFSPDFLAKCTVYASTEPCPMCVGAIYWANVRRVVFGLSESKLYGMVGEDSDEVLLCPSKDLFAMGKKDIEVVGPLLESEAAKVHQDFWK
jgi:tRNA(Arg) A34 adenosine deaminase TadA